MNSNLDFFQTCLIKRPWNDIGYIIFPTNNFDGWITIQVDLVKNQNQLTKYVFRRALQAIQHNILKFVSLPSYIKLFNRSFKDGKLQILVDDDIYVDCLKYFEEDL